VEVATITADFGPRDQFAEVVGVEVRTDIIAQLMTDLVVDVAQADPANSGEIFCQGRAHPAHNPAADHGQPDLFLVRHSHSPVFGFLLVRLDMPPSELRLASRGT